MANQVAETILAQLGGNKFVAMTGAKNLGSTAYSLSFNIGRNAAKVTHVRIVLTDTDDYSVEFLTCRGARTPIKTVASYSCLHADQLREAFERATGMRTSLEG